MGSGTSVICREALEIRNNGPTDLIVHCRGYKTTASSSYALLEGSLVNGQCSWQGERIGAMQSQKLHVGFFIVGEHCDFTLILQFYRPGSSNEITLTFKDAFKHRDGFF